MCGTKVVSIIVQGEDIEKGCTPGDAISTCGLISTIARAVAFVTAIVAKSQSICFKLLGRH